MRCNDAKTLEVSKLKLYIFSREQFISFRVSVRDCLVWAGERISLMLEIDKTQSAHSHFKPHEAT